MPTAANPLLSGAMPLELSIALRYLAASRKRAHVALLSAISVGGLAVGVAALVLSIALLTGFQDRIRERLARETPHLVVTPAAEDFFVDPAAVGAILRRDPRVASAEPYVEGRGWVADAGSRSALPARFRSDGSVAPGQMRLSSAIAGQLGSGRGSEVRVVANRTELSPLGAVPVFRVLRVAALLSAPLPPGTPDVALSLEDARVLAGAPEGDSGFAVRLRRASDADAASAALSPQLGPAVRVRTWMEVNTGLDFALRLEKALIFVTVFLVVVVAALNVISDLALLVVEKRRDLGVLSTLGLPGARLGRIYAWLGASIGLVGTAAGASIGAALAWALDRWALVPLPAGVYLMTHVPFAIHPRDLALVILFSFMAAMGAAALPARSAGRVGPAEALRLSR